MDSNQSKKSKDTFKESESLFTLYVDDNFNYMDTTSRYKVGTYKTWEEAVAKAKQIVEECILPSVEDGRSPEEAYRLYTMFGEEPWILGDGHIPSNGRAFSAWNYAKEKIAELCMKRDARTSECDCNADE